MRPASLLSGGEKALTTFRFSLLLTKPSPFYLLDRSRPPSTTRTSSSASSISAGLDQDRAQFIVVTHQRRQRMADALYGVTPWPG